MNITLRDTPCALGFQTPMSGVSSIVATIYACLDNLAHVIGQGQVWASQVEDVRPSEHSRTQHIHVQRLDQLTSRSIPRVHPVRDLSR